MERYVYDTGRKNMPTAIARHPYPAGQGWSAELLRQPTTNYYTPPGSALTHLGADNAGGVSTDGLVKALLLLGLAFVLWKLITPGAKRNPGGRNKVAKVWRGARGWQWKLVRKGAAPHGPFGSADEAAEDAESHGYSILD